MAQHMNQQRGLAYHMPCFGLLSYIIPPTGLCILVSQSELTVLILKLDVCRFGEPHLLASASDVEQWDMLASKERQANDTNLMVSWIQIAPSSPVPSVC